MPRLIWANYPRLLTRGGIAVALTGVVAIAWALWPSGTQWVVAANPAPQWGNLTSVSCSTPDVCLASSGDQLLMLTDHGTTWAPAGSTFSAFDQFLGVGCGATRCLAASLNNGDLFSSDGGLDFNAGFGGFPNQETFAQAGFPMVHANMQSGFVYGDGVSCDPSGSMCLVMRGVADVARNGNMGNGTFVLTQRTCGADCIGLRTASVQYFPNAEGAPLTPDCVTATVCWAYGQSASDAVWRTTNAGRTWVGLSQPSAKNANLTIDSISCATPVACAVGDDSGNVYFTDDAGRTWTETTIDQWQDITEPCNGSASYCQGDQLDSNPTSSLYCWTATHCLAASAGAQDGTWQKGWRQPPEPNGAIAVTSNAGATWTTESIPGGVSVNAVSCTHGADCWAVGESTAPVDDPEGVILRLASS